jgi:Zn-dependent protease
MVKAFEPVTVLRETKKFEFKPRRAPRIHLNLPQIRFSRREFRDITIAILLFILAFLRFYQPRLLPGNSGINVVILATIGFGASLAFLVHELAHKFMATYLGSAAEFKLEPIGVAVTAISALAGLPVIVPGAVNITGYVIEKESIGKIALIGPVTNIAMALIARVFSWNELVWLNVLFAFVNLLPFFILDGKKIFYWSRLVWSVAFLSALAVLYTIL